MIEDLRDWLRRVAELDELVVVHDADWRLDIGTLCEMWGPDAQALLFDRIRGYRPGLRVLTNALQSPSRLTLTLGLTPTRQKVEAVRAIRDKIARIGRIPPVEVEHGPVLDVIETGDDIDLFGFPVPLWHQLDGGRYIGTGSVCVTRDPESGWINLGAYRAQVHDRRTTGLAITLGKHGLMIMERYWQRGEPAPIAVSVGHDPLLFAVAGADLPYGVGEYDEAGGYRGAPVEVVRGPASGLPIPARAELVIEGEVHGDERLPEGPHAEWNGYYASGRTPRHVVRVTAVCHRRDPIILGATPGRPPSDNTYFVGLFRAAAVWNQLERAGVPGVTGVWQHECGGGHMLIAVAIRQMYPGHSKQAGHIAAFCQHGAYCNRLVVVVDDDVNPADMNDVMWAMLTRTDFRDGVDLSQRNWTSPLDTSCYPVGEEWNVFNDRVVVDACRPWERRESFPPIARNDAAEWRRAAERFADVLALRRRVAD